MKRLLFLVVALFWLFPNKGMAQITIHPEVGTSLFPFTLNESHPAVKSNRLDFMYGVSAYLSLGKNLFVQTKISYTDREDLRNNYTAGTDIYYLYDDFIRRELNIDFSLNHELNEYFEVKLGPSLIRSFAGYRTAYLDDDFDNILYSFSSNNSYAGGINTGISLKFHRFRINLSYLRVIRMKEKYFYTLGQNRFDLTVSYHLLGGDKEKKH